jgi:hypothetical protein
MPGRSFHFPQDGSPPLDCDSPSEACEFREDRPLANVDAAVRKLLEIASGIEADHAGRLQIGTINSQFVSAGGTYNEYSAAVKAPIERGYVIMHPSGAYLSFTQAGADLFA